MNRSKESSTTPNFPSQDLSSNGSSKRSLRTVSHVLGVLSLIWALIAWAEWFLIPLLYPHDGSPVPYLEFAPLAIALLLGCFIISIVNPLVSIAARQSQMLIYAVPAAAFVVFQIGSFVLDIFF